MSFILFSTTVAGDLGHRLSKVKKKTDEPQGTQRAQRQWVVAKMTAETRRRREKYFNHGWTQMDTDKKQG
jgi:aromatic ring-opening dioxygenase catalytic subunit (LigB family)